MVKVIDPSVEVHLPQPIAMLKRIEAAARTCYRSEGRTTETSYLVIIGLLLERGHEAMLEHESFTARFVCDRGVSHELVRHRVASFAQESTRYCNYAKDSFGGEITVIRPVDWALGDPAYEEWHDAVRVCERAYLELLRLGAKPEMARSVLPSSLKTEVVMTANLREWRHVLALRTSDRAHPEMLRLMRPMLSDLRRAVPLVFDTLTQ